MLYYSTVNLWVFTDSKRREVTSLISMEIDLKEVHVKPSKR